MSFRNILSMIDEKAREEMGDYLIISKDRINELASNFEKQVVRIRELSGIISEQQEQIGKLHFELFKDQPEQEEQNKTNNGG